MYPFVLYLRGQRQLESLGRLQPDLDRRRRLHENLIFEKVFLRNRRRRRQLRSLKRPEDKS